MKNETITDICKAISQMGYAELSAIKECIETQQYNLYTQRKRELWEDILTAISNYEDEFGPVSVIESTGEIALINRSNVDEPSVFKIKL